MWTTRCGRTFFATVTVIGLLIGCRAEWNEHKGERLPSPQCPNPRTLPGRVAGALTIGADDGLRVSFQNDGRRESSRASKSP